MNGFATAIAAAVLLQAEPAAAPPEAPAAEPAAEAPAAPRPPPAKRPAVADTPDATSVQAPASAPRPAASSAPAPGRTSTRAPTSTPTSTPTPTPTPTPTSTPTPTASPTSTPARARADAGAERAEAERAARAFLDALAANDAGALAAAAADRFSFDGDTVAGRDAVRAQWRALLAERAGPLPRVGSVELLPSADAIARLGKPPARVAPLARPGGWVAVADVGGRPLVLFVAREGGRMAVLGMHD